MSVRKSQLVNLVLVWTTVVGIMLIAIAVCSCVLAPCGTMCRLAPSWRDRCASTLDAEKVKEMKEAFEKKRPRTLEEFYRSIEPPPRSPPACPPDSREEKRWI